MMQAREEDRLGRLEHRIDARFEQLDETLSAINGTLQRFDERFARMDERFERIETADREFRKEVNCRFDRVETQISNLDDKFFRLNLNLLVGLGSFMGVAVLAFSGLIATQI